ncbi:MAG: hypothetical protein E5W72_27340, partial [Mesorhizobium sp.]
LWAVREEANRFLFSIKGLIGVDISIPLARMGTFLQAAEAAIREYALAGGHKLGAVAQPLRAALTGKSTSPGVFDVLAVLG